MLINNRNMSGAAFLVEHTLRHCLAPQHRGGLLSAFSKGAQLRYRVGSCSSLCVLNIFAGFLSKISPTPPRG